MKYKLLKDTPTIKAGTIGELVHGTYKFFTIGDFGDCEHYLKRVVESSPDWFEPVIERWRAKLVCQYYFLSSSLHIETGNEANDRYDAACFESGNYFRTEEQAEEASRRIKKVLMDYHKEISI
jgi:hypothetical protein